mgnify:CR=1 FL=1
MIILKKKFEGSSSGIEYKCGREPKYYDGWDAALRAYNTLGCRGADMGFVEKVNVLRDYYRDLLAAGLENQQGTFEDEERLPDNVLNPEPLE